MSLLQRVVGTAPRSSTFDCSSRKDPRRLENWVEQQRRPNCSHIAEYDFPDAMPNLDSLVVTAMFGLAASLADLLRLDLHGPDFAKDSAWGAITNVITRDHSSTIKDLLGHKALRSSLCCTAFFYEGDEFHFLIRELREEPRDHGNDILCLAARSGCLVLVKTLFVEADRDGDPRRSILVVHRKLNYGNQFLGTHQSIGEAAYKGHADFVRFPCQQTDIEPPLLHTSQDGNTVFHLAARGGNAEVSESSSSGGPKGSPGGEAETANFLWLLLSRGKADATGRNDDAGYSPLGTAIRGGSAALYRVLIVEGLAGVTCAVGMNQTDGKLF